MTFIFETMFMASIRFIADLIVIEVSYEIPVIQYRISDSLIFVCVIFAAFKICFRIT